MAVFLFSGKTAQGKAVKGELEASNETEARVRLRAQRIIPLQVVEKRLNQKKSGSDDILSLLGFSPSVKQKDLQIFTRQMSTLINAGIPIVQALDILGDQSTSPVLKRVLKEVKSNVEGGKRLGDSMLGWPKVFNTLYVSLVKAGEEGGVLDVIFSRLAAYIEKAGKLRNKILGAMWYPVGVMIVAFIVVTGLLLFVIPKFESIFKSSGQELPALTNFVINISHSFGTYFIGVVASIVIGVFAITRYYATSSGRYTLDSVMLNLPLLGPVIQKGSIARFARTMSTMLSCGVAIMEALDICGNVVGNAVVEKALMQAKAAIAEGKSMTAPLATQNFIPKMVVQMISIGEATGALDTMLGKIADFYEEEVDAAVEAMTSMMEPLMMVVLGAIIAVIVIAMYLPIFNLAGTIK